MRRRFLEWLADRLQSWSYRFEDYARLVRPRPLEQFGPPTQLQMITREALRIAEQKWAEDFLASQERWAEAAVRPMIEGAKLKIKLPESFQIKQEAKK